MPCSKTRKGTCTRRYAQAASRQQPLVYQRQSITCKKRHAFLTREAVLGGPVGFHVLFLSHDPAATGRRLCWKVLFSWTTYHCCQSSPTTLSAMYARKRWKALPLRPECGARNVILPRFSVHIVGMLSCAFLEKNRKDSLRIKETCPSDVIQKKRNPCTTRCASFQLSVWCLSQSIFTAVRQITSSPAATPFLSTQEATSLLYIKQTA